MFDRGYDMNRLFIFVHEKEKHFVIRLTEKRILFYKGKSNGQRQEEQIAFLLYRIGLGIHHIMAKAHSGIRTWFHIGRPKYVQLSFPLLC